MKVPFRSPNEKVGGMLYFGRMIDKIRAHAASPLDENYAPFLGKGFDAKTCNFLKISYPDLSDHVLAHPDATDDQLLEWAFTHGRRPDDEAIFVFNEFCRKYGWNDEATDRLKWRKDTSNLSDRADIVTMFHYIDVDEGR
ncbi:MAG: DUF5069 domain-containing protein [Verrucomicrobia bacterium]|nr:DUF5069 domain-containing protein [Verrucomicrobiota bacterium]